MKKVSIIIPVYNLEALIERCINSVIIQTYNNIEVLIIDDGSTDKSSSIIKKLKSKDKRIKYYYKKNGGQASARNMGINLSTGDYIMFVDGDDWIEYSMIEEMIKATKTSNYDLIVCDYYRDYSNKSFYINTIEKYSKDEKVNLILSVPGPCFKIYKKSLFEKISFLEGIIFEDLAIIPYVNSLVNNYYYIKKAFYHYCIRNNSTMQNKLFTKKEEDIFLSLDYLNTKIPKKYKIEMEYLYIKHLLYLSYLRNIKYNKKETKEIREKIFTTMYNKYPNWKRNKYFNSSPLKQKIIIYLIAYKINFILKLLLFLKKEEKPN